MSSLDKQIEVLRGNLGANVRDILKSQKNLIFVSLNDIPPDYTKLDKPQNKLIKKRKKVELGPLGPSRI
ncbi:hypothetical protein LguiA_003014 [Lonicera macranthoides]